MNYTTREGLNRKIPMDSPKTTGREEWSKKISDILEPRFQHQYVPIKTTTLHALSAGHLQEIYSFLAKEIIWSASTVSRPACPIKGPNQHSLARWEYKEALRGYIVNRFNLNLWVKNPCAYPPALLEALANYCEWATKEVGSSKPKSKRKLEVVRV